MGLQDDIFEHYKLSDADTSILLEMWKFLYPKDEPYIINSDSVYLNKKYPSVSPYQLIHVVKDKILSQYWKDRFYCMCFTLRMKNPMDLLNEHYLKVKAIKEGRDVVEEKPKEVDVSAESKAKTKKTSAKKKP